MRAIFDNQIITKLDKYVSRINAVIFIIALNEGK